VKRAFVIGDEKETAPSEPVTVDLAALAAATTVEQIVESASVDLTATSTKSAEPAGETKD
jgi:hypothetical protein